jgi:hypothetical protein
MPKGPDGQCRPIHSTGNAVHIVRPAVGEIENPELIQSVKQVIGLAACMSRSERKSNSDRHEISGMAEEVR